MICLNSIEMVSTQIIMFIRAQCNSILNYSPPIYIAFSNSYSLNKSDLITQVYGVFKCHLVLQCVYCNIIR